MKEEIKKITRNEYFALLTSKEAPKKGIKYEILSLDLSGFPVSKETAQVANAHFIEETVDCNGNYMLKGHWSGNKCCRFAERCSFKLTQIDDCSAYAYSDEQMAIFTYCEGDVALTLFTDYAKYDAEKRNTIREFAVV